MCCAGPDIEEMEGGFLSASFSVFCLLLIESVQWCGNDWNTVRKVVKLCSNYTRKNAQVVTSLQTSCNKSVHKLSTSSHCLFLVCCDKFGTSC